MSVAGLDECRHRGAPKKLKMWVTEEQTALLMHHAMEASSDCLLWELLNAGAHCESLLKEPDGTLISAVGKAARDGSLGMLEALLERGATLYPKGELSPMTQALKGFLKSSKDKEQIEKWCGKIELLLLKGQRPATLTAQGGTIWKEMQPFITTHCSLPAEAMALWMDAGADLKMPRADGESLWDKMQRLQGPKFLTEVGEALVKIEKKRQGGLSLNQEFRVTGSATMNPGDQDLVGTLGHTAGSTGLKKAMMNIESASSIHTLPATSGGVPLQSLQNAGHEASPSPEATDMKTTPVNNRSSKPKP